MPRVVDVANVVCLPASQVSRRNRRGGRFISGTSGVANGVSSSVHVSVTVVSRTVTRLDCRVAVAVVVCIAVVVIRVWHAVAICC